MYIFSKILYFLSVKWCVPGPVSQPQPTLHELPDSHPCRLLLFSTRCMPIVSPAKPQKSLLQLNSNLFL